MPDDLLGYIARLIADGRENGLLAEEVADVLWMARYLSSSSPGNAPLSASPDTSRTHAGRTRPGPPASHGMAQEHRAVAAPSASRNVEFHALPSRWSTPARGSRRTASVRVPAVTALPDALGISRALRHLKRRVPRPHAVTLDEEATSAAFGDTGLILPVWHPATERWLQIDLVVDASASMVIWQHTAAELLALLEHHGAFRNVRAWVINSDHPVPHIMPFSRHPTVQRVIACSAAELIDPGGRRAVLVLTDAVGKGWHSGEMAARLLPWADSCSLAIIQVLPRRLWHRTALEAVAVTARIKPGTQRPFCVVHVDDWVADKAPGSRRPAGWVPVLYPSGDWLQPWAAMVGGTGEKQAEMFAVPLFTGTALTADLAADGSVPADEPLRRFQDHEASPEALELAGYLAAAPLVLPVMRLVQRAMLPRSAPEHLAEVFLSGLLGRADPVEPGEDPDAVLYEFPDGVREQLLGGLTQHESLRVLEVLGSVSGAVAKRFGGTLDFRALAAAASAHAMPEESLPFARIAASVLRGLGGTYRDLAAYLSRRHCQRRRCS